MRLEDRGKDLWKTFTADMARYTGTDVRPWSVAFLKRLVAQCYMHPGLLAVVVYRYGQWVEFRCRIPGVKLWCNLWYYYWFQWVRTRLQIEVPRTTAIDAGFRIDHFGSIIINCQVSAGKNLTVTHGVLIGQSDSGVPVLADGVAIGTGAKVIGGITLGDNVLVGAGAVVTKSFPDNAIVAGVPARLLRFHTPESTTEVEPTPSHSEPEPTPDQSHAA